MNLDKNSPVPLYHQLKRIIEDNIATKAWPPGYQLPTEQALCKQLDVSLITVRRAIHDLVKEGLLTRQQGRGTFVEISSGRNYLLQMASLSDEGEFPHQLISFTIEKAGTAIAKKMYLHRTDDIVKIVRMRIVNNKPIGLKYTYIPYAVCPGFNEQFLRDNINTLTSAILKNHYNVQISEANVCFSPHLANEYESGMLEVAKGSPIFVWERALSAPSGQIVEYSKFIVRQENASYNFIVKF